jgi:hypothetical protein
LRCRLGFETLVFGIEYFVDVALQLLFFGLHVLYGERDDRSTNLYCHGVKSLQPHLLFEQNDGTELRGVVLNVEAIFFALDDGMAS